MRATHRDTEREPARQLEGHLFDVAHVDIDALAVHAPNQPGCLGPVAIEQHHAVADA